MKKNTKSARPTDDEVRAPEIFDRFSTEQQVQIDRLVRASDFQDEDEVIETLAASALFTLGLDPLADDAFCRLSSVVFDGNGGGEAYDGITLLARSEAREAGESWTKKQRNAERPVAMKGRAA
ncbi:MAG TPA: hypothetical protein VF316_24585 [Polyangiaceae bacterium]